MGASLEKQRLVACISGSGTTMEAIGRAIKDGTLSKTELVGIIASNSNKAKPGIERALNLGLSPNQIKIVEKNDYHPTRLLSILGELQPDVIGLYGFMKRIPPEVINQYPDRLINQHPGPIDPSEFDFGGHLMVGKKVHLARLLFVKMTERAYWTDVTSQRVAENYDQGKVLHRVRVPIYKTDTPVQVQERALPYEWLCQIETLKAFEGGEVKEQLTYKEMGEPLVFEHEKAVLKLAKTYAAYNG